tara:strand:- start:1388 stop:1576 length:189 start_codon:yes stop_codon:yes gene_type:complete
MTAEPKNPVQEDRGAAAQNQLHKKGAKGQKKTENSQINGAARILAGQREIVLSRFHPHCPNR